MVNNGWMMMAAVLVVAYLFATLFPTLGGLLLIGAPLAVLGAGSLAACQVRKVRLTVTDEIVRVSNGKTGMAKFWKGQLQELLVGAPRLAG